MKCSCYTLSAIPYIYTIHKYMSKNASLIKKNNNITRSLSYYFLVFELTSWHFKTQRIITIDGSWFIRFNSLHFYSFASGWQCKICPWLQLRLEKKLNIVCWFVRRESNKQTIWYSWCSCRLLFNIIYLDIHIYIRTSSAMHLSWFLLNFCCSFCRFFFDSVFCLFIIKIKPKRIFTL